MSLMKRIAAFVIASMVGVVMPGCSKRAQTTEQKLTWERISEGNSVAFKVRSTAPISTVGGESSPILYVGCGKLTTVMVKLPGDLPKSVSFSAKVGTVLDGANAQRQDWDEMTSGEGDLFVPKSAEAQLHLIMQLLDAKSLKVELTPKGGSLQSTTFNVQGFKDNFTNEPACKSWRDPSLYQ
jgi:hypothetical protein